MPIGMVVTGDAEGNGGASSRPLPLNSQAPNAGSSLDAAKQLEWYYSKLFPIQQFVRWLGYGSSQLMARREISFTLQGDVYIRFRSFRNVEDLHAALKQRYPIKIDIGACYNYPPAQRATASGALVPMEKELVFDIDMTDYDDVIGNGAGGSEVELCDRNWDYMAIAVQVLDRALRQDFGFRHIMWVYSGRRGVHCWVADPRARKLSNEARVAIADFLAIQFEGRENVGRRALEVTNPLHPSLARAKREFCEPAFKEVVLGFQGMLDTPERVAQMLKFIPDSSAQRTLQDRLQRNRTKSGLEKWSIIESELKKNQYRDLKAIPDYLILRYTYPRLDINVSKEINHLLKSPFCVHPKTGRVCIPFDPKRVAEFRPGSEAPTLEVLLAEHGRQEAGPETLKMQTAVKLFEAFISDVEIESQRASLDIKDHNATVDFLSSS